MARYISRRHPIAPNTIKRRTIGTVVVHHNSWEDVRFTRVRGGWRREDFVGITEVVSSAAVAAECNRSVGCKESWAKIY